MIYIYCKMITTTDSTNIHLHIATIGRKEKRKTIFSLWWKLAGFIKCTNLVIFSTVTELHIYLRYQCPERCHRPRKKPHTHQQSLHFPSPPIPWKLLIYSVSLWVFLVWIFHMNGILQYVAFCVWLFST